MGDFDVINIVETGEEKNLAALLLRVGAWGNVKTTTYKAFTREDMDVIIGKMGET